MKKKLYSKCVQKYFISENSKNKYDLIFKHAFIPNMI